MTLVHLSCYRLKVVSNHAVRGRQNVAAGDERSTAEVLDDACSSILKREKSINLRKIIC